MAASEASRNPQAPDSPIPVMPSSVWILANRYLSTGIASTGRDLHRFSLGLVRTVAISKPESTEGGRRVSVLKRQEGAPVLLG